MTEDGRPTPDDGTPKPADGGPVPADGGPVPDDAQPGAPSPDAQPPVEPAKPAFAWNTDARPPVDPAQPLVAWEAPVAAPPVTAASAGSYSNGPPPFTVGALLSDTFARYGADILRLFVVSVVASGLSWLSTFATPFGTNPLARPTGFVDVSGLLGLASFVAGIVGSSTMVAIAEGGPGLPFGRAIRRGVERAGWLFLTSLLLGVGFVVLFLLALIPVALFVFISPVLAIVPVIGLFLVFLWASLRLMLAVPANVADNLNSIEAVKLSWRVTKSSGVWLRLLGASFLLGLLVAPGAIGALFLVFPALFSGGAQLLLALVPAIVFAVFTPLSILLAFSAYRRLVPPLQPSWTAAPASMTPPGATAPPPPSIDAPAAPLGSSIDTPPAPPIDAPAADAVPQPAAAGWAPAAEPPASTAPADPQASASPAFRVPRLGTAGKALIALALAFDVAGILAIPYGYAEMERIVRQGIPGFPGAPGSPTFPGFPGGDGSVVGGQVAFGSDADLETCTLRFPLIVATAGTRVEWIAVTAERVIPQDEVFLRITHDGTVLETTLQDPGTYDCLGSETPEDPLLEGVYTYEVLVNGSVSATGSLFVQ
jgi:hypothetical protein